MDRRLLPLADRPAARRALAAVAWQLATRTADLLAAGQRRRHAGDQLLLARLAPGAEVLTDDLAAGGAGLARWSLRDQLLAAVLPVVDRPWLARQPVERWTAAAALAARAALTGPAGRAAVAALADRGLDDPAWLALAASLADDPATDPTLAAVARDALRATRHAPTGVATSLDKQASADDTGSVSSR